MLDRSALPSCIVINTAFKLIVLAIVMLSRW